MLPNPVLQAKVTSAPPPPIKRVKRVKPDLYLDEEDFDDDMDAEMDEYAAWLKQREAEIARA